MSGKALVYALQFRGQVEPTAGGLRKQASAPGGAFMTRLTGTGLECGFEWESDHVEARSDSTLAFDGERFDEEGTIVFARGHELRVRGSGRIDGTPDANLRHGTVVWEITGGEGQFAGAAGRITSNFLLSDTGDVTDHQLGVLFLARD